MRKLFVTTLVGLAVLVSGLSPTVARADSSIHATAASKKPKPKPKAKTTTTVGLGPATCTTPNGPSALDVVHKIKAAGLLTPDPTIDQSDARVDVTSVIDAQQRGYGIYSAAVFATTDGDGEIDAFCTAEQRQTTAALYLQRLKAKHLDDGYYTAACGRIYVDLTSTPGIDNLQRAQTQMNQIQSLLQTNFGPC